MSEPELRICEYNVENLFISLEYHAGERLEELNEQQWRDLGLPQMQRRQKPLGKVLGVARALREIDPDVAMLVEVGGRDSLENFCRHFLGDRYEPHFVEGNSARGIDLGFLVRRGLPFEVEARSNRERPVEVRTFHGRYQTRFSRDVAELRLSDASGLRLILLLVHLKSRISTEQDARGKDVRTAEAIALAELYQELRAAHPGTPVVVGGDLNADLASLELELLARTDLIDSQARLGIPPEERFTIVHLDAAERPHPEVIDYLLVSPELGDRLVRERSGAHRYRSFHDVPDLPPRSFQQRYQMPSDHYPLTLGLRLPPAGREPASGA